MTVNSPSIEPANQPIGLWGGFHIAVLCALFGANTVAVKITFTGFGVYGSAAIRFVIAAVVITTWALISGRSFRLQAGQWRPLLVFSALFTMQLALFYVGLDRTYASRAALLVNLLPFIVLVLAHFFIPSDRITRRKVTGLLLGFAGVAFVLIDQQSLSSNIRSGDIIVLAGTLVWAVNTVFLKRFIGSFEPFHIVLYSMLFSVPFLAAGSWFFDEAAIKTPTTASVLALLYQALVTGSFGYLLWNTLLKRHGAVSMHSYIFIMPIAAVASAALMLDEPIGANLLIALAFIVVGVFVVHSQPAAEQPPTPARPAP